MKHLHLAIIPDGNRRWAKNRSLLPWNGHEKAVENFRTLTDFCREHARIAILTVWCFSTENWKRDKKEVLAIMRLLEDYLKRERESFLKNNTRFVHSGRRDRIQKSLAALIEDTEAMTKDCDGFTLHLAVDYGGKDEVVRALHRLMKIPDEAKEVDEAALRNYLDHPELPDIDLILRSSGEQRTSNFFLWQAAYAEWVFNEKHFPDITVNDLEAAIREFDARKRRYGG
ncbi:MAG: polyprenyl diphosphate synthase [Patescibacteria group bacterium]